MELKKINISNMYGTFGNTKTNKSYKIRVYWKKGGIIDYDFTSEYWLKEFIMTQKKLIVKYELL